MKLYKQIIIVLILIYLTLLGSDKIYSFLLNNNLYLKQTYIQKREINADIIILGNCVPYTNLNPHIFEKITNLKTYNLAEYHSNITDNYLSYYIYLKKNKSPKKLIIFTSPETFDPSFNTFNTYRFAHILNDPKVCEIVKITDPNYYKLSFIPFFKYGYYNNHIHFNALQGAKHFLTQRKNIQFKNGYLPLNESAKFKLAYPIGHKFIWDKTQEKQLIELINLAKSKNTEVILYESPVLIEKTNYQPNRNGILKKINAIAKRTHIQFIKFDSTNLSKSNFLNNVTLKGKEKIKFNIEFAKLIKDK